MDKKIDLKPEQDRLGSFMGGLYGTQLNLRKRTISLPAFHNEALDSRIVKVGFGMPFETLLGVICNSLDNAKTAAKFFVELSAIDPLALQQYLRHFANRMITELDLNEFDLPVKPEFLNSPMDFPRPSPTLLNCCPAFFAVIADCPELSASIEALPEIMRRRR
jgi:hypothetical protein